MYSNDSISLIYRNVSENLTMDSEKVFEDKLMGVFNWFYWILCVIGVTGNVIIAFIIVRNAKMRTITNIHIFNIAVVDAIIMIGVLFRRKDWIFGFTACKIYTITTSITDFAGCLAIAALSIDRCYAICFSMSAVKYRTVTMSKIFCASIWLISLLFAIPIISSTELKDLNNTQICTLSDEYWSRGSLSGREAHSLYTSVLGFCLPFAITAISYALVVMKLRKMAFDSKSKKVRKVTRFVVIIIGAYLACWLPYWLIAITYSVADIEERGFQQLLYVLAEYLSYSHSALNPILYPFINSSFKANVLKLFACVIPTKMVTSEDSDYGTDVASQSIRGANSKKYNVNLVQNTTAATV